MKKFLCFVFMIFCSISMNAQEAETAKPLTDMEVVRKVYLLDLEGKYYFDVIMTFKSTTPDYFITDKYKVKVKVTDTMGKTIWKKRLKMFFCMYSQMVKSKLGNRSFVR